MRTNWVREKLQAGQPVIGSFLGLGSPNVAELMAQVGFDFLVIETEHNGLDSAEIEHMLMAINGAETIPIVRVASSNPVFIQRALDMGGMGILVPMVKTADEAEAIVRATRYPPDGIRSFGPLRASRYTLDYNEYLQHANDNIIVMLIVETKEAVENLETIASVPGVDVLFLGLFDLCLSLGLNPNTMPHPEIDAVIDQVLTVGKSTGVTIGGGAGRPEDVPALQAQGFTLVSYGPDYGLLVKGAQAGLEAFER